MKKLSDRDLGIDCSFEAIGSTSEEVIQKEMAHIRKEHPRELPRVQVHMMEKIHEV